jgi:NADH-quinone oxidoreductase subunit G
MRELSEAGSSLVIVGECAVQHADASWLRAAASFIARATGSAFNEIPSGANAIGLADAGAIPLKGGRDAAAMLSNSPKTLIAYHAGSSDFAVPAAYDQARGAADFHLYIGAFACHGVREKAHAILPIGLPPEIDASYTNLDGRLQSIASASRLPGEARPGWKVLRALGSALSLDGFGFTEIDEVRAQMTPAPDDATPSGLAARRHDAVSPYAFERVATTAIYRTDAVLRRSPALNAHPLTRGALAAINPGDAVKLGVLSGDRLRIDGIVLDWQADPSVPSGAVWIESGFSETASMPAHGATLEIERVLA